MIGGLKRLVGLGGDRPPKDLRGFTTARDAEAPQVEPFIGMEDVSKVFGKGKAKTRALDDVTLQVRRGEFVHVEGPSGCGKTTLLSIMGLLDTATSGTYELNGRDVSTLGPAARAWVRNREVGFIFQSFNLIGDLTAYENVELPLTYLSMPAAERRERTTAALERVGMMDRAKRYPSQLSGGHQQAIGVARAVVGEPEILLADEPTGNLPSEQAREVVVMLRELHEAGSTICLVSHDPRWESVVERVLSLFDGRIIGEKTAAR